MFIVFIVFYILIAAAMIVLILMQRGAGADAGSGFGGGASGTVFGARGSATFLTRATSVLAGTFFLLSLGMAMYLRRSGTSITPAAANLGVMAGAATPAKTDAKASDKSSIKASAETASQASTNEVPAPQTPATPPTKSNGSSPDKH